VPMLAPALSVAAAIHFTKSCMILSWIVAPRISGGS
jgi:hypothetical protein